MRKKEGLSNSISFYSGFSPQHSVLLLSEYRALCPADDVERGETVVRDDLEVARGGGFNLCGRVGLEAKENFEKGRSGRRAHGQVQDVAAGAKHARQFLQARVERDVFECAARGDEIERLGREGQRQ